MCVHMWRSFTKSLGFVGERGSSVQECSRGITHTNAVCQYDQKTEINKKSSNDDGV